MTSFSGMHLPWDKPPANLEQAAQAFTNDVLQELAQGPPPRHLLLFTIGPSRPMRWLLEGAPSPADDLIRAIASHEKAFVVGLVHPTAVPGNVEADRAWVVTCEDAGRRFDAMVALRGSTPSGGADQCQLLTTTPRTTDPRWVGVEPEDVSLFPIDEPMTFGPGGDA